MERLYRDREEAGEQLAERLLEYREEEPLVLAAPRGGVAVGLPVARRLGAPLDVVLVKKLGAPGNPELGFGAVAEDGEVVLDEELTSRLGLEPREIEALVTQVAAELAERGRRYRGARPAVEIAGRTVIVVDDGVATGSTLESAVMAVRKRGARRVVAAVPVSSLEARSRLEQAADAFVCLLVDPGFLAVGAYYEDFPQLTDEEVERLLTARPQEGGAGPPPSRS
ncbi:MAG: phosphoribosyltransferase [Gemmatimonadetes bacterium]|nr:phosphoribosyltransferase [Gemmatimonadota bacterium]